MTVFAPSTVLAPIFMMTTVLFLLLWLREWASSVVCDKCAKELGWKEAK